MWLGGESVTRPSCPRCKAAVDAIALAGIAENSQRGANVDPRVKQLIVALGDALCSKPVRWVRFVGAPKAVDLEQAVVGAAIGVGLAARFAVHDAEGGFKDFAVGWPAFLKHHWAPFFADVVGGD